MNYIYAIKKNMFERQKEEILSKQNLFHYFGFRLESFVIKKRFRLLFGDEFDKEEYKKTKKHLKYIKQNRDLVSIVYVIHV